MANSKDLEITTREDPAGNGRFQATVEDKAANRAWSGNGSTRDEAATDAFRGFVDSRQSAEYVKK